MGLGLGVDFCATADCFLFYFCLLGLFWSLDLLLYFYFILTINAYYYHLIGKLLTERTFLLLYIKFLISGFIDTILLFFLFSIYIFWLCFIFSNSSFILLDAPITTLWAFPGCKFFFNRGGMFWFDFLNIVFLTLLYSCPLN